MSVHKIKENVYEVGAAHFDRRLFDELIPLPDGTTYNSYLIIGSEKTALIDTVDPEKREVLFENLESLGIEKIDFIVSQHAEQDHSGSIPYVLEKYPMAKVVTNKKCRGFLKDLLHIDDEKFMEVEDGNTLSLGDKTLKFILTPWVHWPETMSTYLVEDKIMFTCDFFGSHYAGASIFVDDEAKVIEDAKRYYAEIMMPFRAQIKRNIEKLEKFDMEVIAPSHGSVYRNPEIIVNAYKDWISDRVENIVLIPYVSMHGSTERMVYYLVDRLVERGIDVKPCNLSVTDTGKLAMAMVDAATVILASPQVLAGAHPKAVYAAFLMNALRPKTKNIGIMGSYGWGGRMTEQLSGLLTNIKANVFEPLLVKGHPDEDAYRKIAELADKIKEKHQELGLL